MHIPYSAKLYEFWRTASDSSKFSLSIFPVNTFPMKATINSSKFLTCSIRQISSDFSTVKVLRHTVYRHNVVLIAMLCARSNKCSRGQRMESKYYLRKLVQLQCMYTHYNVSIFRGSVLNGWLETCMNIGQQLAEPIKPWTKFYNNRQDLYPGMKKPVLCAHCNTARNVNQLDH